MPVNQKDVQEHMELLRSLDPRELNHRQVSSLISKSIALMTEVALEHDDPVVSFKGMSAQNLGKTLRAASDAGLTPRQARQALIRKLEAMSEQVHGTLYGPRNELPAYDQGILDSGHRTHQSLVNRMEAIAAQDIEPVRLTLWKDTKAGRASKANAVQVAMKQHGTKMNEAVRKELAKTEGRAFLDQYWNYLDSQFPRSQSDEERITLTNRETFLMARQLFDAMRAQNPDKDLEDLALHNHLVAALADGQRSLRYDLPAEEGILTPDFWEEAIQNDFTHKELLPAETLAKIRVDLQDKLPAHEAILHYLKGFTQGQIKGHEVDPVVRYLDQFDATNDNAATLMSVGRGHENRICVVPDEEDNPIIVSCLDKRLPDHLMIAAPGKKGLIAYLPDTQSGDLQTRAQERLNGLRQIARSLEPNLNPDQVAQEIKDLHARWRRMLEKDRISSPESLQYKLDELQKDIQETAKMVVAPGCLEDEKHREAHQENRRALVRLAFLADEHNFVYQPLSMRAGKFEGTRAKSDTPGVVISGTEYTSDGLTTYYLDPLDKDGLPPVECPAPNTRVYELVSPEKREQALAYAATSLSPQTRDIGRRHDRLNTGFETFTATDKGELVPTGHWIGDAERHLLLNRSSMHMTYSPDALKATLTHNLDPKLAALVNSKSLGPAVFDRSEARDAREMQKLKDAMVFLIHGESITPEETLWACEIAEYDGDYMLKIDMEDLVGAPKIKIHDFVFQECTIEDIRRHAIQKILLNEGVAPSENVLMMERVRHTPIEEAFEAVEAIGIEMDEYEQPAGPMM